MGLQPVVEAGTQWQQSAGQRQWYTVDMRGEQFAEIDIDACHQRERREKMLAKLAVSYPGVALPVRFE